MLPRRDTRPVQPTRKFNASSILYNTNVSCLLPVCSSDCSSFQREKDDDPDRYSKRHSRELSGSETCLEVNRVSRVTIVATDKLLSSATYDRSGSKNDRSGFSLSRSRIDWRISVVPGWPIATVPPVPSTGHRATGVSASDCPLVVGVECGTP